MNCSVLHQIVQEFDQEFKCFKFTQGLYNESRLENSVIEYIQDPASVEKINQEINQNLSNQIIKRFKYDHQNDFDCKMMNVRCVLTLIFDNSERLTVQKCLFDCVCSLEDYMKEFQDTNRLNDPKNKLVHSSIEFIFDIEETCGGLLDLDVSKLPKNTCVTIRIENIPLVIDFNFRFKLNDNDFLFVNSQTELLMYPEDIYSPFRPLIIKFNPFEQQTEVIGFELFDLYETERSYMYYIHFYKC